MPQPADPEAIARHPWWKAFYDSIIFDQYFTDDDHRRRAIANYFGLVSFADDNVGKLLSALEETGLASTTRVAYMSDHGDSPRSARYMGKEHHA